MPAKHSRHVALTAPLAEWVDAVVARGEYASLSDLVRTALRRLQDDDKAQLATQTSAVQPLRPSKKAPIIDATE